MAQGFDFICPSCLMSGGRERSRDNTETKLNTIRDIAFSMPDSMFQALRMPLEKDHPSISKELNEKRDLICCITWQDITDCLVMPYHEGNVLCGTYTLTTGWLKQNCDRFRLDADNISGLPDDMILLERELGFYHSMVDGHRFPEKIRDWDSQVVISNERRCARCGQLLSPDTGRARELRILLQGSSRAGKTSCIIAILSKLLEKQFEESEGFRAELTLQKKTDENAASRYHEWLWQEICYYRQNIKVEKTDTVREKPIIYSLLVKVDRKEMVLTFVDMPGEYFDEADEKQQKEKSERLLKLYAPIYELCDSVWTCLRYETVVSRELTDEQWAKLANNTGLSMEIASHTEYAKYRIRFRELTQEFQNRGYKAPKHAVILTMTDGIVSVYDHTDQELQNMRDNHIIPAEEDSEKAPELITCEGRDRHMVFQERACYTLCHRISTYIRNKNKGLYTLFQSFSPQTKYFAMAAYGHPALPRPADAAKRLKTGQKPEPFQIDLPLLWTMAVTDHLPIQYEVNYTQTFGFLRSLRERRTSASAGQRMHTCDAFSDADKAAVENLLNDNETYMDHLHTLKRGESL